MSDQGIAQFKGKFVEAVLADNDGESKEYKVEEAAGDLVILREKGKSAPSLVKLVDIISFTPPAPKPPAPLKARRQNPVDSDDVKRHLVDSHGYKVTDINSLTVEQAVELHEGIDHEALDLGHFHALSKREQAIAEGGPSSDATESQTEGEEDYAQV